jgi:hypothetical protein
MNIGKRNIAAIAVAVAALIGAGTTSAFAATQQSTHAGGSSVSVNTGQPNVDQPSGCAPGNFCDWLSNGAICFNSPTSEPYWTHLYAPGSGTNCGNTNNEEYNNAAAAGVRMYPLTNYYGAWNCLGYGDYYLNNASGKNKFTEGQGKEYYNDSIYHHVTSSGNGAACS